MINGVTRFLDLGYVLTLFLVLPGIVAAQSFSVSAYSDKKDGQPNSYVEPYVNVTNNTSSPLDVQIEIVGNTLPSDWSITVCLANCFAPGMTKFEDQMDAGATYPLKFTVSTGPETTSGIITIELRNKNIPSEEVTLTYEVSTLTSNDAIITPRQLVLAQNYPNPVSLGGSTVTTIAYSIPRTSNVGLKVYNLLGKEVRTLVSEQRPQGMYTSIWDGKDNQGNLLPPGVYVYKLSNGKATQTRRMLITK